LLTEEHSGHSTKLRLPQAYVSNLIEVLVERETAERQETKLVLEDCLHFLAVETPKAVLGEIFQDGQYSWYYS